MSLWFSRYWARRWVTASLADVDFYFYPGCPWTYLAFSRLREAAMRTGARIVWRPILVERVREAVNPGPVGHGSERGSAQVRYAAKDLQDWARFCGVRIGHHGPFPVAATWAARGATVAIAAGRGPPYCEAVFRGCFEEGADIDDLDVVSALASRAGLEPGPFREATANPGSLRTVEACSDELVARGGFGSPTMFVGDDMYFGNDRMPLVELALGRAAERPFVAPGAHGQT